MKSEFLSLFKCPYCNGDLSLNLILVNSQQEILYGTVYCGCDEYPILEGILYINKVTCKKLVFFLQNNQTEQALLEALFNPSLSINRLFKFKQRVKSLFLNKRVFNQLSKRSALRILTTLFPKAYLPYYFNRAKMRDSLLFFLPLSLTQLKSNKQTYWLNIGAGIHNYYNDFQHTYPKLTFISVESEFLNCYLSRLLFPAQNALYICLDISKGICVQPGKIEVITGVDVITYIERQRQLVDMLTQQHVLQPGGLLILSSVHTHMYLTFQHYSFPISPNRFRQYFPSHPTFLDEITLLGALHQPQLHVDDYVMKPFQEPDRFLAIWPEIPSKSLRRVYIPNHLLKQATHYYEKETICWKNCVY